MRGRKPKVTPAAAPGVPVKPDWLGKIASARWDELVAQLGPAGRNTLAVTDGWLLAAHCEACENYVKATKALRRTPQIARPFVVAQAAPHG